eukprot:8746119-Prorocentrum_lima.AAC.1
MSLTGAVLAFEEAAWESVFWLDWKPCNTMMSFANGQKSLLKWCVVINAALTCPSLATTARRTSSAAAGT